MNKNMRQRSGIRVLAAAMLASVALTACGGSGGASPSSGSSAPASSTPAADGSSSAGSAASQAAETPKGDPNPVTWMTMLHTETPASDEMVAALGELTNTQLTFQWIPDASKEEKLTTALASKNLADVLSLPSTVLENATVRSALQSDMFWDVEPYLSEFPELAKISKERLDSARISGKVYGVPFQKPVARYGVVVRQDWLDNLGLEVPHTFEDLMQVAKAFTENDPDGNGAADTRGFADRDESFNVAFRMISGWYGAPNYWEVLEDGTLNPFFMNEHWFEAAEAYRGVFENGWVNQDFATMPKNDQKNYVVQGKAGIVITGLYDAKNYVQAAKETGQADTMKWTLINDMTANGQTRRILSDTNGGFGGLIAFPKTEVKDEAELRIMLQFVNDIASREGFLLMTNGIEGVHYEFTGENQIKNLDQAKWGQEVQALSGSRPNELWSYEFKVDNEYANLSNQLILENEQYAVFNPAQSLDSPAYTQNWNFLLETVKDAYYKYIMGDIDMAGLRAAVDTWKSSGGQTIIDEFSAEYKRIYG